MSARSSTHLVLIPSYNPGPGVLDTVRAARAQWAPVWVVVDGSTDGTAEQLQALAASEFAAPAQVSTIDGLRVDWPDGFGLIRASNTTPVLVLRFEGQTAEALARIEARMLALLERVKPGAKIGSAAH